MFLGRHIAEHGAAVPSDHGGADPAGDVVVAGRDVGGERSKGVERSFVAPFQLFFHVLLDHVHRDMARSFVHDLDTAVPSAPCQVALDLKFRKLGFIVGVCN